MNLTLKALCAGFSALLMLGCGAPPTKYITEIKNEYVVLDPPKELYSRPKQVKPPNPKLYIDASWEKKEEILMLFTKEQDKQIDDLITDRNSIDRWVKEEKAKIEKLLKEKQ